MQPEYSQPTPEDLVLSATGEAIETVASSLPTFAQEVLSVPTVLVHLIIACDRVTAVDLFIGADWTLSQFHAPDRQATMPGTIFPSNSVEVFVAAAVRKVAGALPVLPAAGALHFASMDELMLRVDQGTSESVVALSRRENGHDVRRLVATATGGSLVGGQQTGGADEGFTLDPCSAFELWGHIGALLLPPVPEAAD
jgi:hypothetical protein